VEAMHGASVVALNMYDMLKPIDKGLIINNIRLESKKGGKSDYEDRFRRDLRAAVVVCSDSIAAGQKEDKAGKRISEKLKEYHVSTEEYNVIPDEVDRIRTELTKCVARDVDILIYTGGTGLSKRDITPEALKPELDREIPGISEAIRAYGQERMPYAMLSRSLAGIKGQTLVLALPGSTRGAEESMDAIFPFVLHLFRIMKGVRHD
jgi:cyclic pyranopterin phosphate synthase